MSTSIILLDQNFNANDVDIILFEASLLFSPAAVWGRKDDMVPKIGKILKFISETETNCFVRKYVQFFRNPNVF